MATIPMCGRPDEGQCRKRRNWAHRIVAASALERELSPVVIDRIGRPPKAGSRSEEKQFQLTTVACEGVAGLTEDCDRLSEPPSARCEPLALLRATPARCGEGASDRRSSR